MALKKLNPVQAEVDAQAAEAELARLTDEEDDFEETPAPGSTAPAEALLRSAGGLEPRRNGHE
jgi:hypothetical protein